MSLLGSDSDLFVFDSSGHVPGSTLLAGSTAIFVTYLVCENARRQGPIE